MPDLAQANFDKLREWAPLVSMDLNVMNQQGQALLGFRKNEPAKNTWFVPGGRIRKDESFRSAFARIVRDELGLSADLGASANIDDAVFIGVFEHHYPAKEHVAIGSSVHYVVLAYRLVATGDSLSGLPTSQHADWRWFDVAAVLADPSVHANTKAYFRKGSPWTMNSTKLWPIND